MFKHKEGHGFDTYVFPKFYFPLFYNLNGITIYTEPIKTFLSYKQKRLLGKVLQNTAGTWVRIPRHFVRAKLGDVLCNLVVPPIR